MWLITLLEKLFCFVPRVKVIPPDEAGYRSIPNPFTGKVKTKELKPSHWYWVWPLFMEYEFIKIKTQVKDVRVQSVWTKDGKDMAFGVSIRLYVQKPLSALLEVYDYDESLQNIVLGLVAKHIREHTLEELKSYLDRFNTTLLDTLRIEARGWGLYIQKVQVTDVGTTRNLRLLTSGLERLNIPE